MRELENILERAVALAGDDVLLADDLMLPDAELDAPWRCGTDFGGGGSAAARTCRRLRVPSVLDFQVVDGVPTSLGAYLDSLERDAIRCALAKTRYNRTAAAQLLGIHISTTAIPDATARHQVIIGADGWLDEVRRVDSPNFDARPPGSSIELIVIHNISLPPGSYGGGHIERLFTNTLDVSADPFFAQIVGARVSAHILIDRDGTTAQFVSFTQRAWHAGTLGIQRSYPLQRFFDRRSNSKEPISNRLPTPNTAR